jgi:dolichol-phosphate mannosyltransferase
VVAVVRPGGDAWRLAGVQVAVEAVDLRDGAATAAAFARARPEWVFHAAARGGYSWQDDARSILESTVLGASNVLGAARDAQVVVQAGSSSEYGPKDHAPDEDEPLAPDSVYGVAKAAATALGRIAPVRTVTLRLYSVYGPWEDPRRFVPTLLRHALAGGLPPLVSPDTARDFVHVDDVVDAFLRATGAPAGAVYNVGSGRQTTIREAVDLVRRELEIGEEPRWGTMPARSWDTDVWVANVARARAELGWAPQLPFAEGLRATLRTIEEPS